MIKFYYNHGNIVVDIVGIDDNRDYNPVYRTFVAVWLILGLAWVALTIGEVSENFKAKSQKVEDKIIEIDQQITGKVCGFLTINYQKHRAKKCEAMLTFHENLTSLLLHRY